VQFIGTLILQVAIISVINSIKCSTVGYCGIETKPLKPK